MMINIAATSRPAPEAALSLPGQTAAQALASAETGSTAQPFEAMLAEQTSQPVLTAPNGSLPGAPVLSDITAQFLNTSGNPCNAATITASLGAATGPLNGAGTPPVAIDVPGATGTGTNPAPAITVPLLSLAAELPSRGKDLPLRQIIADPAKLNGPVESLGLQRAVPRGIRHATTSGIAVAPQAIPVPAPFGLDDDAEAAPLDGTEAAPGTPAESATPAQSLTPALQVVPLTIPHIAQPVDPAHAPFSTMSSGSSSVPTPVPVPVPALTAAPAPALLPGPMPAPVLASSARSSDVSAPAPGPALTPAQTFAPALPPTPSPSPLPARVSLPAPDPSQAQPGSPVIATPTGPAFALKQAVQAQSDATSQPSPRYSAATLASLAQIEPVAVLRSAGEAMRIEPVRAEPALPAVSEGLATSIPASTAATTTGSQQSPGSPAPTSQFGASPTATTAMPTYDLARIVENIARAREEARPAHVEVSVRHADFGPVSLRFEQDRGDLTVALASSDPDFARAVANIATSDRASSDRASSQSDNAARQDQLLRQGSAETGSQASGNGTGQSRNGSAGQRNDLPRHPDSPANSTARSAAAPAGLTGHRAGIFA